MFDSRITVILPIRDRAYYTKRWISYANESHFPFFILIADGGKDPLLSDMLCQKDNFPNLKYEYLKFTYDENYTCFLKKIDDSISKVSSHYTVLADDDDFFSISALSASADFLDKNSDYSSCRGQIVPFIIQQNQLCFDVRKSVEPSFSQSSSLERVKQFLFSYNETFYDVTRTADLQQLFSLILEGDFQDLFLAGFFMDLMTAAKGKVQRLPEPYLFKQIEHGASTSENHLDHFNRMLLPSWSHNFHYCIEKVSDAIVNADLLDKNTVKETLLSGYRSFVTQLLITHLYNQRDVSLHGFIANARAWLVRKLNTRKNKAALLKTFFNKLRWKRMSHNLRKVLKKSDSLSQNYTLINDFIKKQGPL